MPTPYNNNLYYTPSALRSSGSSSLTRFLSFYYSLENLEPTIRASGHPIAFVAHPNLRFFSNQFESKFNQLSDH